MRRDWTLPIPAMRQERFNSKSKAHHDLKGISTTSAPESPGLRTTVTDGEDTFWSTSNNLLHWLWSWQLQFHRLKESTHHDGEGASTVEVERAFSRTSLDEHLLAVVGAHVAKAVEQFGDELPALVLNPEHLQALQLLRNLYEHWDEQRIVFQDPTKNKKLSAKKFVEGFPDGRPYSITYVPGEWLLAGVVPLNQVTGAIQDLETAILNMQETKRAPRS